MGADARIDVVGVERVDRDRNEREPERKIEVHPVRSRRRRGDALPCAASVATAVEAVVRSREHGARRSRVEGERLHGPRDARDHLPRCAPVDGLQQPAVRGERAAARSHVQRARGVRVDRDRPDGLQSRLDRSPGPTGVLAAEQTVVPATRVDDLPVLRVDREGDDRAGPEFRLPAKP